MWGWLNMLDTTHRWNWVLPWVIGQNGKRELWQHLSVSEIFWLFEIRYRYSWSTWANMIRTKYVQNLRLNFDLHWVLQLQILTLAGFHPRHLKMEGKEGVQCHHWMLNALATTEVLQSRRPWGRRCIFPLEALARLFSYPTPIVLSCK